ncbi:MAG TPA: type I 3-dehydroquinate dehydratase, partial [Candidatus Dorea intestinavium]|nr:type I 3-dehydroquinate dehydratase [Candidatus Dorea intestinavium]
MKIRNTIIGGGFPKICVPILESDTGSVLKKAKEVAQANPDLIEFRIDYYKEYKDTKNLTKLLGELRDIIGDIPLLLTCR